MNKQTKERYEIFHRDKFLCYYCGIKVFGSTKKNESTMGTIDHLIPKANGGTDEHFNLVTACAKCNTEKNDRNIEQYREKLMTRSKEGSILAHLINLVNRYDLPIHVPLSQLITHYQLMAPEIIFHGENRKPKFKPYKEKP